MNKCQECKDGFICNAIYYDGLDMIKYYDSLNYLTDEKMKEVKECKYFGDYEIYINELENN